MKKNLIFLLICLFLLACSSPMDTKFTTGSDYLIFVVKNKKKLDASLAEEELSMLRAYIFKASKLEKEEQLVGKTYQEILDIAKQKKKEKEEAEAKAKAEEEARAQAFAAALQLTLVDKGFLASDFMRGRVQDYITITLHLKNTSDKGVMAFNGMLIFKDLLDEDIMKVNYTFDDGLSAGAELTESLSIPYNQFMDGHRTLRSKGLDQIKTTFRLNKIRFIDGSMIE